MSNTLTLVDLSPTPQQVYIMLEALYETEGLFKPEDTKEVIDYLEARLIDAELPLTPEQYEEEIQSPENSTYKQVNLWQDNTKEQN